MLYNDAYKYLISHTEEEDSLIRTIIEGIIREHGRGLPLIINRNPTIGLGSIIQVFCTGICTGFTMSVSLCILSGLEADFDSIHCPYMK